MKHLFNKLYFKTRVIFVLFFIFLSCSKDPNKAIKDQLPDPLEAGWEGQKVCAVVEENEKLRVLQCTFPPGVGHEKHYHAPHVGYTIKGGKFKITDSTGVREVNVPEGYVFSNDVLTVHEVLNTGKTTAEFLIIEYK